MYVDMKAVTNLVEGRLKAIASGRLALGGDIHHVVSSLVCETFKVWDFDDADRDILPEWVMFLVAGYMRKHGLSQD